MKSEREEMNNINEEIRNSEGDGERHLWKEERMKERKRQRIGTIRQTRVKCERDGTHEKFYLKLLCN